jgi:hypothetical protein
MGAPEKVVSFLNDRFNQSINLSILLKWHLHTFFSFQLVWQKNLSELLIKDLNYFRFCSWIGQYIQIFCAFCALPAYAKFHSVNCPHMLNFILHVVRYRQCHSSYYPQRLSFFWNQTQMLCISGCAKLHSSYPQNTLNLIPCYSCYMLNFIPCIRYMDNFISRIFNIRQVFGWNQALIPHIISMREILFHVLSAYFKLYSAYLASAPKNSNIWNETFFLHSF